MRFMGGVSSFAVLAAAAAVTCGGEAPAREHRLVAVAGGSCRDCRDVCTGAFCSCEECSEDACSFAGNKLLYCCSDPSSDRLFWTAVHDCPGGCAVTCARNAGSVTIVCKNSDGTQADLATITCPELPDAGAQ